MVGSATAAPETRGNGPVINMHGRRTGHDGGYGESGGQGQERWWAPQSDSTSKKDGRLAQGLGWFSLGLGLAQVTMPGRVTRLVGVRDHGESRMVQRLVGARELMAAAGILSGWKPGVWLWARVAGDVMDLALLGVPLATKRTDRAKTAAALAAVAGVTVLDAYGAWRRSGRSGTDGAAQEQGMSVKAAITVNRPVAEVYGFWHDFKNLPRFMGPLEEVRMTGEKRSHWRAKAPGGGSVEWDAETTEDRPNELIAWRSVAGSDVENSGTVRFAPAPGGRGTEVRVDLRYEPPAGPLGAVGAAVSKLFGEAPDQQVRNDLRAFKQVMETGEVPQSEATIHGRPHPAQPPEHVPAGRSAARAA